MYVYTHLWNRLNIAVVGYMFLNRSLCALRVVLKKINLLVEVGVRMAEPFSVHETIDVSK